MLEAFGTGPILGALLNFAYLYPLFMAYVWMAGGLYYFYHWEARGRSHPDRPPKREKWPGVSILVPCYNEGEQVVETVEWLLEQDYPDYEIIAVNDGSQDNTGALLDDLAARHERLRVIHFATNQGKAMGLRMAAMASRHEFLVCIDGDALLDHHACKWLVHHMLTGPRVGAVTGNPRIRTRSTLIGRLQVGEFSATIGLIKRAQRIYGRIFTVSGVVVAVRKAALHRTHFWSLDMVTEDIDMSWNLQSDHWDIRYEPNALVWILMPETLKGLWSQRLRWAQGGAEALIKHLPKLWRWHQRRTWGVIFEYFLSVIWAYLMLGLIVLWLVGRVVPLPETLDVARIIPAWHGVVLGVTCLIQFAVSLAIDSRFERGLGRYYYWMIWYPIAYWLINMASTVVGFIKAVTKPAGTRAVWKSPDRGIRSS